MSWQIPLAHQGRSQTLSEALECGVDRAFEGEEHRVFIQLLLSPPVPGLRTMGELEDHLEGLDQDSFKALVDRLRTSAGLPSATQLEDAQKLRKIVRDDPPRPMPQPTREQDGSLLQQCAASDCEAISTDAAGVVGPVKARRWHCPIHLDQAEPGDMEDWQPEPVVRLDPLTGGVRFIEEDRLAAEHYDRLQEQRAEERRKRQEQLKAERERVRALEDQLPKPELRPGQDPYATPGMVG
jgi:hypothetical protein